MNNKIFIKPDKFSLSRLLEEVKKGRIQAPIFQRDFVWTQKQIFELCESISEGYPIGSFLFWNPGVTYETKTEIAGYTINAAIKNKEPLYILDGFHRISTIFGVLSDFKKNKQFAVYYDLIERNFTLQKNQTINNPNGFFMPLHIILDTYKYLEFIRQIDTRIAETERNELINSIQFIVNAFREYEIAYTEIIGGDISSAINIFYRLNTKGTEISKDFMLSALSYNNLSNFTLSKKIDDLLNTIEPYNFSILKRDTILNCISPLEKVFFDTNLEDLIGINGKTTPSTPNLESLCASAFEALTKTIHFLYNEMKIIHFSLLPYSNQLIFISNYFKVCPTPTEAQINTLKNWVWVSSYANYFTIYSLSQQREAYDEFMKFAKNSTDSITGIYDAHNQFRTATFPSKIFFGSVRSKNLQLFMLQRIYGEQKPVLNETYKQIPIFDKKNKQPANIIVCASTDLSKLQNIAKFFEATTSDTELEKFFLNKELRNLYLQKDIETFLSKRKQIIQDAEEEFVKSLDAGIIYDRESSTIDEPDN